MPLDYEPGVPEEWESGVDALDIRMVKHDGPRRYEIFGPCPRCGHELSKDVTHVLAPALGLSSFTKNLDVRVVCNACTHPGAPEGLEGCGAEGSVHLDFGA